MLYGTKKFAAFIKGIDKRISAPLTLGNTTYTPADLKKVFQTAIDTFDASSAANAAWHASVETAQTSNDTAHALGLLLASYLLAVYGKDPTFLEDFGLKPRKAPKATVADKSQAISKAKATREARHTLGKVQKKAISGQPPVTPTKG